MTPGHEAPPALDGTGGNADHLAGRFDSSQYALPEGIAVAVVDRVSPCYRRIPGQRATLTHYLLHVVCPQGCRHGHTHGSGGPDLKADMGWYQSHCGVAASTPYRVVIPDTILASARRADA